ncbi:MAG: PilZ domain-containing protein [Spirochaetota bacterium]
MPGSSVINKEKRDFIRMEIQTEVICKIRGNNEEFKAICKNLSHTGIQLSTSKHIKEGSELDIAVKVSGGIEQPPLQAVLAVKRVTKDSDNLFIISGELKDVR